MYIRRWAMFLVLLAAVGSCKHKGREEQRSVIGLWQGVYQEDTLSMEFRNDGRAILLSDQADDIVVASYKLDLQHHPAHLDINFRRPEWGGIQTIVEQVEADSIRVQHLGEGTPRPEAFTADAIVFSRASTHVMPQGVASSSERDQKVQEAITMDMVWYDGQQHEDLLEICETLFRHQFTQ